MRKGGQDKKKKEEDKKNTQEKDCETLEPYWFQRETHNDIGSNPTINRGLNRFSFEKLI